MTDETIHTGKPEAEFRRQMRGGQMMRFINTLPAFSVERDMPDHFAKLLRQLDRAAGKKPSTSHKASGRRRGN